MALTWITGKSIRGKHKRDSPPSLEPSNVSTVPLALCMVAHTSNSSAKEAKTGGWPQVQDYHELHTEFQTSLGYRVRPISEA